MVINITIVFTLLQGTAGASSTVATTPNIDEALVQTITKYINDLSARDT